MTSQANRNRPCGTESALRLDNFGATCTAVGIAFALLSPTFAGERSPSLRADADYTARRSDSVNHNVDFSIIVTPPYQCKVLKVWVPIPQSDFAQQVGHSTFTTFPMRVEPRIDAEPVYGNRFAHFEFRNPQGAQIIRHRFSAKVWNLHWNLAAENVESVEAWPKDFAPYLQPQKLDDAPELEKLLRQFQSNANSAAPDFTRAMQWIDANLDYDHVNASLQADANHAFARRRGHCSDYHGLCATLSRAMGRPSRVTYGISLFPKNSPSHCKLEMFLPPYGWVSLDLSETQKLVKKIDKDASLSDDRKQVLAAAARRRLHAGFRENSWLLLTKGTDYDLVPKASQKVRVVRTAYIEADGEPLPDPDPANSAKREFAWMTAHKYTSDKTFKLPFQDVETLRGGE